MVAAEAQRRLTTMAREQLAAHVGDAVQVMHDLMKDDAVDENGRPMAPASVRLDAAQFIVQQILGKAKVSVSLDAGPNIVDLLAKVLVNEDGSSYTPTMAKAKPSRTTTRTMAKHQSKRDDDLADPDITHWSDRPRRGRPPSARPGRPRP
jgi:hypothetical protein